MKPFFSIIIPCCDVELYVKECLDSVLQQSFGDWECLLGIETCKDRTEEVIRETIGTDPRFRIFKQERSGSCSATRNTGTDMAQGEYVIFLDGDDTIAEESLARLAAMIKANPGADLYPGVIIAYTEGTDKREIRENYPPESSPKEMTGTEATLFIARKWNGLFCPMLQLTVFRREFLIEHNLKCIYGLRRQDSEFSPRALYLAKRVVPLHEPFYLYRIRNNSVSTAAKGAGYFHKDWAIILRSLMAFHTAVSKEPGFDRRISGYWSSQWLQRIFYFWFEPEKIRTISRERRLETLNILFANGLDDLNILLKTAPRSKRIAAGWMVMFLRRPALRGLSEFLFKIYFSLAAAKRKDNSSI